MTASRCEAAIPPCGASPSKLLCRTTSIGAAILAAGLGFGGVPAGAQADSRDAIGPCSPYATADGDIPSEMPGCTRRGRLAPGSIADELAFRRARRRSEEAATPGDAADPDDGEAEARPRRRARGR